jgi:epoxyqueuosine reductase
MNGFTQQLKEYALEIGYSRVGIIAADDFEEFIKILEQRIDTYDWWINAVQTPLDWARPRKMVPECKSLIVLLYDHAQKRFPESLCQMMGRVYQARCYFAPPDNINGARRELLRSFLAEAGFTAEELHWMPMRWAGLRAGLTTFGKNNCAYAPGLGSFIVFTVIATNATLTFDQPNVATSTCPPDCRRCIDACPTQALIAPFQLDPRRCVGFSNWMPQISYVPRELRPLLGGRIHGCDACQEACPRNEPVLKANAARPRDDLLELLKDELSYQQMLHMSEGYYAARIRPLMYNYIKDPKKFQRNAAIAIGNTHDARYLPDLAQELENDDAIIRAHVAWAIGQIGGSEALGLLQGRLSIESDEQVREELRSALSEAAVGLQIQS